MTRHVKFFTAIDSLAVHIRRIVCFLQFAVRNRVLDLLEIRIFRGRETTDSTAGGKKKMAKYGISGISGNPGNQGNPGKPGKPGNPGNQGNPGFCGRNPSRKNRYSLRIARVIVCEICCHYRVNKFNMNRAPFEDHLYSF